MTDVKRILCLLMFQYTLWSIAPVSASNLYPFGSSHGDVAMVTEVADAEGEREPVVKTIKLKNFILGLKNLYISESGYIGFESKVKDRWGLMIPTPSYVFIAGYVPYDGCLAHKGSTSAILHREDSSDKILNLANEDIKTKFPNTNFKASHVLIVTYRNVTNRYIDFRKNTFQIIIAHNLNNAYIIVNYNRLDDTGALAGFNLDHKCAYQVFTPVATSYKLAEKTNMGVKGRFVYWMNEQGCDETFKSRKYQISNAKTLSKGDTTETYVTLSKPMRLWKGKSNGFYISVNGRINAEKQGKQRTFDLSKMQHDLLIFLNMDFNTTTKGNVYYAEQNDRTTLDKASRDIFHYTWKEFQANQVFIVEYNNVYTLFNNYDKPYHFQAVIASDGEETYVIMNFFSVIVNRLVESGFSSKNCDWNWFGGVEWKYGERTNSGHSGQNIYKISSSRCIKDVLLPYKTNDKDMGPVDEAFDTIGLFKILPFLSEKKSSLNVQSNNILASDSLDYSYYGEAVFQSGSTRTALSLFYNDMFTEFGGHIYWRNTVTKQDLDLLSAEVRKRFPNSGFNATNGVLVTLENAMQYAVRSSRNTMQQGLASDGTNSYAFLNIFRADSTHKTYSGYYDLKCKKGKTFRTYSDTELEQNLDGINPVVIPLISSNCIIPQENEGIFVPTTTTTTTTTQSTPSSTQTTPSTTASLGNNNDGESDSKSNKGVILGASIGGGCAFILVIVAVVVYQKRKTSAMI